MAGTFTRLVTVEVKFQTTSGGGVAGKEYAMRSVPTLSYSSSEVVTFALLSIMIGRALHSADLSQFPSFNLSLPLP